MMYVICSTAKLSLTPALRTSSAIPPTDSKNKRSSSMIPSPLFGGNEPLGSFVEGIGRNLFVYRGYDIFEGALVCFLSLNVRKEENNFVYAPQMPVHIKNLMEQFAVRFIDDLNGDNHYNIFNNDFNEAACVELPSKDFLFIGNGKNPDGEVAVSFSRSLPIDNKFIDHISAKIATCAPFSPALLLSGRYKAMVTTDWKWHAMAGMVGVPSVLLSGPRYPTWINKLGGHQIDDLLDKKASLRACRCPRIELCHAKRVEAKPCMTTASWEDLKGEVTKFISTA